MKHHICRQQGITDGKYREARKMRREMTDSERGLWARVRRNQINGMHFRRQHVISGFIVDFYCRSVKRAIEVDGGIHRGKVEQDYLRDEILKSQGIQILRISNERIAYDIDTVIDEIKNLCLARNNCLNKQ